MCGHLSKNDPKVLSEACIHVFPCVFSHTGGGGEDAKIPWIDVFLFGCGNLHEILSAGGQIPQSYYLSRLISGWYCSWRNFSMCSYCFSDFMQRLSCCFNKNNMIILVSAVKEKGRFRKLNRNPCRYSLHRGLTQSPGPYQQGREQWHLRWFCLSQMIRPRLFYLKLVETVYVSDEGSQTMPW